MTKLSNCARSKLQKIQHYLENFGDGVVFSIVSLLLLLIFDFIFDSKHFDLTNLPPCSEKLYNWVNKPFASIIVIIVNSSIFFSFNKKIKSIYENQSYLYKEYREFIKPIILIITVSFIVSLLFRLFFNHILFFFNVGCFVFGICFLFLIVCIDKGLLNVYLYLYVRVIYKQFYIYGKNKLNVKNELKEIINECSVHNSFGKYEELPVLVFRKCVNKFHKRCNKKDEKDSLRKLYSFLYEYFIVLREKSILNEKSISSFMEQFEKYKSKPCVMQHINFAFVNALYGIERDIYWSNLDVEQKNLYFLLSIVHYDNKYDLSKVEIDNAVKLIENASYYSIIESIESKKSKETLLDFLYFKLYTNNEINVIKFVEKINGLDAYLQKQNKISTCLKTNNYILFLVWEKSNE